MRSVRMQPCRFASAVLLMAWGVATLAACVPSGVSEAEKAAFVTARDLEAMGVAMPLGESEESWSGSSWFDGSKEVEYEFETLDEHDSNFLYLYVAIDFERTPEDARETYAAVRVGLDVASKAGDTVELTRSCGYGEQCVLRLLLEEGSPSGNQFLLRTGTHVYTVILGGLSFTDAAQWHGLVEPRIARLRRAPSSPD